MADEQTIYLSPEEELTSVRERLERTPARRIILVIPQQTQLRSHVGWRLIYARMRELDKELLVISPDQQVRAVARAAGFKVSESQESSSNRPRLGSRSGNINTRGVGRSRIGGSRGGGISESRGTRPQPPSQRRPMTSSTSKRPFPQPPASAPGQESYENEDNLEHGSQREIEQSSGSQGAPATFFEMPGEQQHFGAAPAFRISTTPSVRPSVPHIAEGDEEDLQYGYDKDYDTAQRIRSAARGSGRLGKGKPPAKQEEKESQIPAAGKWEGIDPFAFMEDDQQLAPLPEQRGSAPGSIDEIDIDTVDISDRSTEIMANEIEDLGDQGIIDLPEIKGARERGGPPIPLREQGGRPRPRSGQISQRHLPRSPRPGQDLYEDEDEAPLPLANRPTREEPGAQRPSRNLSRQGGPRASQPIVPEQQRRQSQPIVPEQPRRYSQPIMPEQPRRYSQPIAPEQPRRQSQPIVPEQPRRQSQPIAPDPTLRTRPRPATPGSSQHSPSRQLLPPPGTSNRPRQAAAAPRRQSRGGRSLILVLCLLIVLVVIGGVLFAFVPSATVAISLQASVLSQSIHLNVTTDPHANVANKVLAQTLTHDFVLTGEGAASGSTSVGSAKAGGVVIFTNTGDHDLIIPTNTIIQTESGIQFVTDAQADVTPGTDNAVPVPISAVQAGVNGDVDKGKITVIPPASLQNIAKQTGVGVGDITPDSLTATNAQKTSGGGAINEPAVAAHDLTALKQTLHQKMQQEVKTWLAAQKHSGDLMGNANPDVVASTTPLPQEQLSAVPAINQAVPSGKFSGNLTLHLQVLVARAASLQTAAGQQLNAVALKQSPAHTLAPNLSITLTQVKGTPSHDGTTLAVSATASGEIISVLDPQAISDSLTTKGINQAETYLKTGAMARMGVLDVKITIFPSFLSILPPRASQIRIILQPVIGRSPKTLPN